MSAPTLVKRLIKGSEVTPAEGDANLQALSDYTEAVETLYLEEHNADGTHKYPGTVRGVVTGTVNTPATAQVYNVTVEGTYSTLADLVGITIVARIDVANYYSATQPNLRVNTSLAGPIKKYGDQNLTPGDLRAGQEAVFSCDGVNFQLQNPCTNSKQNYLAGGGTANAVTVTFTANPTDGFEVPSAYYAGYKVAVKISATNTGAATLQISSTQNTTLAAVAIQKGGASVLTGGEMRAGQICEFIYDGSVFQLQGRPAQYCADSTGGGTGLLTFAGGVHTFAHGLGVKPRKYWAELVCVTTDISYAVDDAVNLWSLRSSGDNVTSCIIADATNITVSVSDIAAPELPTKGGNTYTAIAPGKWKVRAYAEL